MKILPVSNYYNTNFNAKKPNKTVIKNIKNNLPADKAFCSVSELIGAAALLGITVKKDENFNNPDMVKQIQEYMAEINAKVYDDVQIPVREIPTKINIAFPQLPIVEGEVFYERCHDTEFGLIREQMITENGEYRIILEDKNAKIVSVTEYDDVESKKPIKKTVFQDNVAIIYEDSFIYHFDINERKLLGAQKIISKPEGRYTACYMPDGKLSFIMFYKDAIGSHAGNIAYSCRYKEGHPIEDWTYYDLKTGNIIKTSSALANGLTWEDIYYKDGEPLFKTLDLKTSTLVSKPNGDLLAKF